MEDRYVSKSLNFSTFFMSLGDYDTIGEPGGIPIGSEVPYHSDAVSYMVLISNQKS